MVGFSADGMSTPFILLSNGLLLFSIQCSSVARSHRPIVQTRSPHALVLETARSSNLATCANLMLRFVSYRNGLFPLQTSLILIRFRQYRDLSVGYSVNSTCQLLTPRRILRSTYSDSSIFPMRKYKTSSRYACMIEVEALTNQMLLENGIPCGSTQHTSIGFTSSS